MEKATDTQNKTLKEAKMSEEAPMYIYATEMVSEYCSILDIEGKNILSITGSGDQIINPILMGAKEVVGFDVNNRAEFITHLKIAAIKSLSYEEFLDFFGSKSTKPSFDYEIYKRIEKELPNTIKRFFTKIFAEFDNSGDALVKSNYFRQRLDIKDNFEGMNIYLKNKELYEKTRDLLNSYKFTFIASDLQSLSSQEGVKDSHFDFINLSNVPNYLVENEKHSPYVSKYDFITILRNLRKKLTDKGKIFFYSYSPNIYPNKVASKPPAASQEETLNKLRDLEDFNFTQAQVKWVNGKDSDLINILEKK